VQPFPGTKDGQATAHPVDHRAAEPRRLDGLAQKGEAAILAGQLRDLAALGKIEAEGLAGVRQTTVSFNAFLRVRSCRRAEIWLSICHSRTQCPFRSGRRLAIVFQTILVTGMGSGFGSMPLQS